METTRVAVTGRDGLRHRQSRDRHMSTRIAVNPQTPRGTWNGEEKGGSEGEGGGGGGGGRGAKGEEREGGGVS